MAKSLSELVSEIVLAQSQRRDLDAEEITRLSLKTAQAFQLIQQMERDPSMQVAALLPEEAATQQSAPPAQEQTKEAPAEEESAKVKMNPMDSIKRDEVICLECGQSFKQISHRHLQHHGLTPNEYRAKYGFSKRQPLTARSVSEQRAERVRNSGLVEKMQKARRSQRAAAEKE